MLKILSTLFDRCLFTLTFILGLQLPEFIQQYSQRLSGHLNEAISQLNEFKLIADRHFDGSLTTMINKYLINSEPSINETAKIIQNTTHRVSDLKDQLFNLQETEYVERVYYFITAFDESMAQATFQQYQLAIPLSLPAVISGALFALTVITLCHLIVYLFRVLLCKKTVKLNKSSKKHLKSKTKPQLSPKESNKNKTSKATPTIGDINNI